VCDGSDGTFGTVSSMIILLWMMVGARLRNRCGTNLMYAFYI